MRKSLGRVSMKRKSLRGDQNNSIKADSGGGDVFVHAFLSGEDAWVSTADGDFESCTVLKQSGLLYVVKIQGRTEQVDGHLRAVYPKNPSGQSCSDMTGLYHINDACILDNMEKRSYADQPYTFMGNVLVSVNPLKDTPAPKGALGTRKAALEPHPYAIAEYAFQQMTFAVSRGDAEDLIVNQSIIASGESGAGKTEASKRVLKHLVERTRIGASEDDPSTGELSAIDIRLLQSNDITESFGNAKTLRNNNSSRFGKFMKLHFGHAGKGSAFHIAAASVQTYLLERSRVSLHDKGERNYHVFYQLLAGRPKDFFLDKLKSSGFRYLAPLASATQVSVTAGDTSAEIQKDDKSLFLALETAMGDMGLSEDDREHIFRIVAGILHLGNVGFADEETLEGDFAQPVEAEYDPLECAASLFGVDAKSLEDLLLVRSIKTREGVIEVHRDSFAASFTRDAVAKGLYSRLFNSVVERVNAGLDETRGASGDVEALPFIGVLDIFGFESFQRNGFEQLLINFTNESLQSTFNRKVFEAELTLYEQEGLFIDQTQMRVPPGNEAGMTLLAGALKAPGNGGAHHNQERVSKDAVLVDLDEQCRQPQPSDAKMLKVFAAKFAKHPNWGKVHPRDAHSQFKIRHYAGEVTYTIGSFIEKNNDSLPREVNQLFSSSSSPVIAPIFKALLDKESAAKPGKKAGSAAHSIVKQFRSQVIDLLETLESTACSFVRCVKPNASMHRGSSKGWFSRAYVAHQLRHLSIPQTALVLRSGLPTRIKYDALLDTYMSVLPARATKRFAKGKPDGKLFVRALFWAFQVPAIIYKLGHTKVFFKAGEIATLDKVLQEAANWSTSKDLAVKKEQTRIGNRFCKYYALLTWRRGYAKALAVVKFTKLLEHVRRVAAEKERLRLEQEKRERDERELRERQEAERIKQQEEEEKALAAKAEEEVKELNRAMTIHKEKTRMIEPDSDLESDSSSDEESVADDDDDGVARRARLVKEIEEDAENSTEEEVARIEKSGQMVGAERRAKIYAKYEEKYTQDMARYEALRQQNAEMRADIYANLKAAQENMGTLSERMFARMKEHGQTIHESVRAHIENARAHFEEVHPELYENALKWRDNVQGLLSNPLLSRKQSRIEDKIKSMDGAKGPDVHALKRSATMAGGQVIRVKRSEVEQPSASAKAQVAQLKDLLGNGEISVDEMSRMLGDIERTLERSKSRTWSENSESLLQGVQVKCTECNTNNNTSDGLLCSKCKKELPLHVYALGESFALPSAEPTKWAGGSTTPVGLQYKGGNFFVQMKDSTRQRIDYESFATVDVFLFECAWETDKKRKNSSKSKRTHTRWIIELSADELGELHDVLNSKLFKKSPPPFPRRKTARRANKSQSRAKKLKNFFKPRSSRRASVTRDAVKPKTLSMEQYIGAVQEWLDQVVKLAAAAAKSKPESPIFKLAFAKSFDLDANINSLKKYL